jgi:choline dehydrogenase
MLYLRGHPLDYDNWANLTGDDTWRYDNLVKYFKKSVASYSGEYNDNGEFELLV